MARKFLFVRCFWRRRWKRRLACRMASPLASLVVSRSLAISWKAEREVANKA